MKLSKKQQSTIVKIAREYGATLVYMFGSYAQGKATKGSDVDIAILLPSTLSATKRFDIRCILAEKLAGALSTPIDVVVLNDISSIFFKFVIIQEGEPLYEESDVVRVMYELRIMNEYYDFEPFLTAYNKAYVARAV